MINYEVFTNSHNVFQHISKKIFLSQWWIVSFIDSWILSYHKVQSQNWLWCEKFLMSESFNHFIVMYSWFDFELFPHLVIYILLSFISHVKYIYTKYGLCYHLDTRKLIIDKVGNELSKQTQFLNLI